MGREVRMVPPNWEHPRYTKEDARRPEDVGTFRPCYDEDYESAAENWLRDIMLWRAGKHPEQEGGQCSYYKYYWEYDGPPDEETCRSKFDAEATWFQLYETVSEGTPVSPPFATKEELAQYLADNGDFWYQNDQRKTYPTFRSKPTYEQAFALINEGYAFSMVRTGDGRLLEPHEQALELGKERQKGN